MNPSPIQIGRHVFTYLGTALEGAEMFAMRANGVNYLFTRDIGCNQPAYFGASWCRDGGKVQTIAHGQDAAVVMNQLAATISQHKARMP